MDKQHHLEELAAEIAAGKVDTELLLYLPKINVVPWLCTILSCIGHDAEPGYIKLISDGTLFEEYIYDLTMIEGVMCVDKTWCYNDDGHRVWYTVYFDNGATPDVLEEITTVLGSRRRDQDSIRGLTGFANKQE